MISDLQAKIIKEGAVAQKTYDEFAEWCEDRSRNVGFEIKDGKKDVASETATIESSEAKIASLKTKIEELADAISTDEADLSAATKIRNTEAADFAKTEKEMVETIDTLERAILILEKEMKKGGAALVQMQKAGGNLAKALAVMVDASMIASQDAAKLTVLVQNSDSEEDSEEGAPAAAVYEGHSGGIIDTLESLLDKAKASLETARAKEAENNNNFMMLKQGLEDEIKYANKDLGETKKGLAKTEETKATAEGDLSVASKDLKEDTETLATLHQDCLEKANDFEAETKSRGEELKALALAKKNNCRDGLRCGHTRLWSRSGFFRASGFFGFFAQWPRPCQLRSSALGARIGSQDRRCCFGPACSAHGGCSSPGKGYFC